MTSTGGATRVPILVIFGAWTLVCLLVTTQTYLSIRPSYEALSWTKLVLSRLVYWSIWALLTPLIFLLSRVLPIERERWLRSLLLHALIASVMTLGLVAIFMLLLRVDPIPEARVTPFREDFVRGLGLFFHFDFLTYFGVLGIGHWLHSNARFRERSIRASQLEAETARLEAKLAAAQLEALRNQIQPHFLFNTLHAISSLMDDDTPGARRMITRLSDLLRLTLAQGGRQQIGLGEELEIAESYLAIEAVRFADRLRIEWEIAPETLSCQVPSLILQPLIENAVRHGVARAGGVGEVSVRAGLDRGDLVLEVADDGAGLSEAELATPRTGVGLTNIETRLAQLYGRDRAALTLESRTSGGVRARVQLPCCREAVIEP